jgi:hypothetical protein
MTAEPEGSVNAEAFTTVCMAHGFHAVACPAFKEMHLSDIGGTAGVMLKVSAFANRLKRSAKTEKQAPRSPGAGEEGSAEPPLNKATADPK